MLLRLPLRFLQVNLQPHRYIFFIFKNCAEIISSRIPASSELCVDHVLRKSRIQTGPRFMIVSSLIQDWRSVPWSNKLSLVCKVGTFTNVPLLLLKRYMIRRMTKPTNWLCAQRRLVSAWAFAPSDQCLLSAWRKFGSLATHWAHSEDWSVWPDSLGLRWAHIHFVDFVVRRIICTSEPLVQVRTTIPCIICVYTWCVR